MVFDSKFALFRQYRRIWRFVAGVAATSAVLLACGCDPHAGKRVNDRPLLRTEILRRGIAGEPASLDPGRAGDTFSFEIIRDLYEGLVTESPTGEVKPGTAVSWTINSTSTQYTFLLRDDAKWSNGNKVRAQDFVSAWQRVVDPKRASPGAEVLRPIANAKQIIAGRLSPTQLGVRAEQDNVLVVELEEPTPYFLQLLTHSATYPVFSEESASAHGSQNWISNGPYILSTWTAGASLKLSRNPQYWDSKNTRIKQVEYYTISDENSELTQYRAGQLDLTDTIPASALPLVRAQFPNELLVAPYLGTVYYAINLDSSHVRWTAGLRQALAMAVDRKTLQKTILIFGQMPAYGFVPPGTWNYDSQFWQWKSMSELERVTTARRLYEAAGYSNRNPLHLRVLFNASPAVRRMTVAISAMWRETLGVETELIDEEYRVFLDSRKDKARWDIARLAWVADYNDASNFLNIFRHSSANNDEGLVDASFDSLLEKADSTPSSSIRKEALEHAERIVLADYPIIPIYFFSSKRLIKPYVKGAQTNALNRLYSKDLFIETN